MRLLMISLLCGLGIAVSAQKTNLVYGYLKDSISAEPVVLASVTNMNTGTTVMTNYRGLFKLPVTENQVLSFGAIGYKFDTLRYNDRYISRDTLVILLPALRRNLGMVTVRATMSRYQVDSMQRRKDFLQDIVNYTIPTIAEANSGAGIALNISRFSRHERSKRKAFAFYESTEKEAYINYRFNEKLVTAYSGLKGDQLYEFMQAHRPSYQWLRAHLTEEDLKYYINEQLKLFFKRQ
ncbi:hypothetical protein [Asinibacterium sp. OR53]|jgi:hypothetical protein|uniref:hypothetical protein n=1 Tax=Asinibacterium sp. OR53 TaxID=925409 RepID=UPI0004AD8507|nr:hypothetical protein [Asinibacterium sp. OR53]